MAIFNSYVKLPEGKNIKPSMTQPSPVTGRTCQDVIGPIATGDLSHSMVMFDTYDRNTRGSKDNYSYSYYSLWEIYSSYSK